MHRVHPYEGSLVINNQGVANLYGKELKNVVATGVALQAQFTPAFSVKVGYQGAYNHDTKPIMLMLNYASRFNDI